MKHDILVRMSQFNTSGEELKGLRKLFTDIKLRKTDERPVICEKSMLLYYLNHDTTTNTRDDALGGLADRQQFELSEYGTFCTTVPFHSIRTRVWHVTLCPKFWFQTPSKRMVTRVIPPSAQRQSGPLIAIFSIGAHQCFQTRAVWHKTFVTFRTIWRGLWCVTSELNEMVQYTSNSKMSILVHSSAIPVASCSFLRIPVPFLWTPVEWVHSCRNQWGMVKYCRARPFGQTLSWNKHLTAIVTSIRDIIHNSYITEIPKFLFRKEIQILTCFGDFTTSKAFVGQLHASVCHLDGALRSLQVGGGDETKS